MPKLNEETKCHFSENECEWFIPEDQLKELIEEDDLDEISMIPQMSSDACRNCLLSQIVFLLHDYLKTDDNLKKTQMAQEIREHKRKKKGGKRKCVAVKAYTRGNRKGDGEEDAEENQG